MFLLECGLILKDPEPESIENYVETFKSGWLSAKIVLVAACVFDGKYVTCVIINSMDQKLITSIFDCDFAVRLFIHGSPLCRVIFSERSQRYIRYYEDEINSEASDDIPLQGNVRIILDMSRQTIAATPISGLPLYVYHAGS